MTLTQPAPQRQLQWAATPKQLEAYQYLTDNVTTELVYGGAAGGAKSYLGCAWMLLNMYAYPGCRGLLGRAVLKQLKQSTLLTLFEVAKDFGLIKGKDYKYNAQEGTITFMNGSEIFLKDLAHYPSDPDYDSLGSTEYTFAFIDEASQVTQKAKNVVKSRLRYKLNQYNLIPKVLMTCNPSKNFLYSEFYKPWKKGELPQGKHFIISRVQDNPYLPQSYIETLKTLDKISQERLLHGNWEYDDDPAALMDIDAITDLFIKKPAHTHISANARSGGIATQLTTENNPSGHQPDASVGTDISRSLETASASSQNEWQPSGEMYIVCDVARFGADRTVITVWQGLTMIAIFVYTKTSTVTTKNLIREKMAKYGVSMANVLIDEDGIGGGVKDQMPGSKGFIAMTRPFKAKQQNYTNVKAQCAYALAKAVQERRMKVMISNPELKEQLTAELEQIKAKDIDKDGKLAILPKDAVREALGRSPDLSDCLMMRMWFEFKPKAGLHWV